MQQVLHFSAVQTGAGYLAVALTAVVSSGVSQALVTRIGVKPVLAVGLALLAGGLVYFTQISVHGSYASDLLPGFLLVGVGLGFSFVPISIAALAGVEDKEAGLASGLINTNQQIGGAIGLALLTTVATTRTDNLIADGTSRVVATVEGFQLAFWVAAAIAAAGVVVTLLAFRRGEPAVETQPATAEAG